MGTVSTFRLDTAVVKRYTQGQCDVLAYALWLAHGCKGDVVAIYGWRWGHFYYKHPNGTYIDVWGKTTRRQARAYCRRSFKIKNEVVLDPCETWKERAKHHKLRGKRNGGHVTAALHHIKRYESTYLVT